MLDAEGQGLFDPNGMQGLGCKSLSVSLPKGVYAVLTIPLIDTPGAWGSSDAQLDTPAFVPWGLKLIGFKS